MTWEFGKLGEHVPDLSILRRCWPPYEDTSKTHEVVARGVKFGGSKAVIVAGPCAVESLKQTLNVARAVRETGVQLLRGGAFKPRSNPNDFQGLGVEGLEILAQARQETGLGIVTEVMDPRLVATVAQYADVLQIGTRSMYNYPLLKEVGRTQHPILLKRNWSATIDEWLCSAEYIAKEGNRNIILCERGIRASAHWAYARCVLDLNIIEPLRRLTPLPVIVDPSHATGRWTLVPSMSRAALMAGAHGLLIEAIESADADRSKLHCDEEQGIPPEMLADIVKTARSMEIPAVYPKLI